MVKFSQVLFKLSRYQNRARYVTGRNTTGTQLKERHTQSCCTPKSDRFRL